MFTGLIKEIGTIKSVSQNSTGREFIIKTKLLIPHIKIDDSVAVNGCCLTATEVGSDYFKAQAVHVTLEKTTLKYFKAGDNVNLELAMSANDRFGGHFVQGHIGGIGQLINSKKIGDNFELKIEVPKELSRYIVLEGSIALDGISLTVADIKENIITVSIIPHTWTQTILGTKKIGDALNIETDMMAKYIENFLTSAMKDRRYQQNLKEFFND